MDNQDGAQHVDMENLKQKPESEERLSTNHIPVLINQVVEFLSPAPGKVLIDCTLGLGGHTEALLSKMEGKGSIYGIEVDERNLALAKKRLAGHKNVHFIHDNFENLAEIGKEIEKKAKHVDGILFDLGLSSLHVDEKGRGFSFKQEGPLDMRFDTRRGITAAEIVNTYPLDQLLFIFQAYGEEKFSYRIAQKILEHRKLERFTTTSQLANFISTVVPEGPHRNRKIHPATRIFQALRVAANREIEVLQAGITAAIPLLSPGGRIVVISYHSLEDRVIKHFFKAQAQDEIIQILTKRPIEPDVDEVTTNRRSRSAKLRAAEKL